MEEAALSKNVPQNGSTPMASWAWERLLKSGSRINDFMEIRPLGGKKKIIKLDRTHFKIRRKMLDDLYSPLEFNMPVEEGGEFILKLLHPFSLQIEKGRFFLCATGDCPFILNGNVCYQSFINRYDQVQIAGEDWVFLAGEKDQNQLGGNLKESQVIQYFLEKKSLLLVGETGTGKGEYVRRLKEEYFSQMPFIHLNLPSLGEKLIESELFGHLKGSFTGAIQDRLGAFRSSKKGLLFLDELDSLPIELQVKLLVALEERKIRPVGSDREYEFQGHLVLGLGRRPEHLMAAGIMRKDFFYRLKAIPEVCLPSLRDQVGLIDNFCLEFSLKHKVGISPELMGFYRDLPWPGNYRQLKAHLEHKLLYAPNGKMVFDKHDEELLGLSMNLENLEEQGGALTMGQMKKNYAKIIYQRKGQSLALASKTLDINLATLKRLIGMGFGP